VEFQANGNIYNMTYYLADVIYPKWITFVMPVRTPKGKKKFDFHNAKARKMWKKHLRFCKPNLL
jgi:hypothetical protein